MFCSGNIVELFGRKKNGCYIREKRVLFFNEATPPAVFPLFFFFGRVRTTSNVISSHHLFSTFFLFSLRIAKLMPQFMSYLQTFLSLHVDLR